MWINGSSPSLLAKVAPDKVRSVEDVLIIGVDQRTPVDDAKPLVEARVNAVEDARVKAETYARALNVRLGRVLAATEGERKHRPMPMIARAAPDRNWVPPIERGTNELSAQVIVMWELKQD